MKWQQKVVFGPIESNAEVGPALQFAICREKSDAMREFTEISGPACSVYVTISEQTRLLSLRPRLIAVELITYLLSFFQPTPIFMNGGQRFLMVLSERDGNFGFWKHIAMITTPVSRLLLFRITYLFIK